MKHVKKSGLLKKSLTMLLALMMVICYAAMSGIAANEAYAADYTYLIKVYSGKEGYFGDSDTEANHARSVKVSYNDVVKIDINDGIYVNGAKKAELGITLLDDEKYYVRGVKIAGHDNDEVSTLDYQSYEFNVNSDMSFALVYGMKGGMIKYTVNYLDEAGDPLIPSEEFYGMIGDKPVVSYAYIEGYQPRRYNLARTLTDNEADNVFDFVYVEAQGETIIINNNGGGGGAGGAGTTEIVDANTPEAGPGTVVDLDDNQTPTSDGTGITDGTGDTDIDDSKTPLSLGPGAIAGGAAVVMLIAAIAVIATRRKKSEEE